MLAHMGSPSTSPARACCLSFEYSYEKGGVNLRTSGRGQQKKGGFFRVPHTPGHGGPGFLGFPQSNNLLAPPAKEMLRGGDYQLGLKVSRLFFLRGGGPFFCDREPPEPAHACVSRMSPAFGGSLGCRTKERPPSMLAVVMASPSLVEVSLTTAGTAPQLQRNLVAAMGFNSHYPLLAMLLKEHTAAIDEGTAWTPPPTQVNLQTQKKILILVRY